METNRKGELVAVIQALLVKQRRAVDLMATITDFMDEAARELLAEAKKESRKGERRAKR